MKRDQILGLDLVRFSAALMVVFFHLTYWISRPAETTPGRITGWVFDFGGLGVSFGWVGVEIFFVLSGFVIAYSASSGKAFKFLRSRILRLAPAAWVCATLSLLAAWAINDGGALQLAARYVRSVIFFPGGPWIDGTYWTLGIEIVFYGAVFVLISLKRFWWIEGLAVGLALVCAGFWGWHLATDPSERIEYSRLVELFLVRHGCFFALGVMLWLANERGWSALRIATTIGAIATGLVEIYYSALEHDFGPKPDAVIPALVWLSALAMIGLSVRANAGFHKLAGTRGAALLRTLGLATYPLYLLHQLIGSAVMAALWRMGVPQPICLAVAVVSMLALSILVARVAEPWVAARLRTVIDGCESIGQRWKARFAV